MARTTLKSAALALALAIAGVGCNAVPRLDATSYEQLNASLNAARSKLYPKDVKRFDKARQEFNAVYFANGKDTPRDPKLPDWRVVHGMTASEFFSFVRYLKPVPEPEQEATFPDPALSTRLLASYKHELSLLQRNRDSNLAKGRSTIDEFPIVDVAYVPPLPDTPLEYDKAAFLVSIRNDSGFDAYKPRLRLTVRNPKDPIPVLSREFEYDTQRDPIEDGETLTMRFECCSLALDPVHNGLLKNLASDGQIEVELLQVKGPSGQDMISQTGFGLRQAQRMKVLELCIQRISADLRNWVPYAEADQPGGCGDPNQAENLLAMWEQQGVKPPKEFAHLAFAPGEQAAASSTPAAPAPLPSAAPGLQPTSNVQPPSGGGTAVGVGSAPAR
jgi:hypothetical protein